MSKIQLPSFDFFTSQAPSTDSFLSTARSKIDSINTSLPTIEKFKSDFEKKIEDRLGNFDLTKIPEPKMPGEIASMVGDKVGINIDSEKVNDVVDKYNTIKAGVGAKALDGAKKLADKAGIKIPEIPSEEEITQMIVNSDPEKVEDIDNKISAIESYIQSKLS